MSATVKILVFVLLVFGAIVFLLKPVLMAMSPTFKIILIVLLVFVAVVLLLKPASRNDEETLARLDEIKRGVRRPPKERKKSIFSQPEDGVENAPFSTRLIEAINGFIKPSSRNVPLSKTDAEIKKLLAVANINISMATFVFLRMAVGALSGVVVYFVATTFMSNNYSSMQILIGSLIGFLGGTLMPKTFLRSSAKKRRMKIVSSLTDTIDLIAISVEAGLGYDAAIMNIWQKNKSPAMQELVRTIEDINYGMSRKDAYQSLAARCDVDEMTLFANNMSQADVMGIPIVNVLKAQADALRTARRRRAESQIQKAPVKMLLPLVLFIFPTMLVVLIGPAIINITRYMT